MPRCDRVRRRSAVQIVLCPFFEAEHRGRQARNWSGWRTFDTDQQVAITGGFHRADAPAQVREELFAAKKWTRHLNKLGSLTGKVRFEMQEHYAAIGKLPWALEPASAFMLACKRSHLGAVVVDGVERGGIRRIGARRGLAAEKEDSPI